MNQELPDVEIFAVRDDFDRIARRYIGAVVDNGGRVLLVRRRVDSELRPGCWEVPVARLADNENLVQASDRGLAAGTCLQIEEITAYHGFVDFIDRGGVLARLHLFAVSVTDVMRLRIGGDYEAHSWEPAEVIEEFISRYRQRPG
ncbi:8-oxo-dGTP diphosphatase [Saccharopolyspora shandongensis]|uniref:8-oxo-dGTP diphosphatase n=1 Tax=Saccharopolyspora shandongensis TaxID=418495 RepID=A0A1H3G506_9PSEU|nr:hypothetical protein [Saccharopolyspora shandongensis]SDX98422.1 8-oxo-dGTP diphosphatase [Saccharopolyspora shandongensis]